MRAGRGTTRKFGTNIRPARKSTQASHLSDFITTKENRAREDGRGFMVFQEVSEL